jgi:hypothetical protein
MSAPYYVIEVLHNDTRKVFASQVVSADSGYLFRETVARRLAKPLDPELGFVNEKYVDSECIRVVKSYHV